MADDSSLPNLVRGPDGTVANVSGDGLYVTARPINQVLEEMLSVNKRILGALVVLLGEYGATVDDFTLNDLGE